MRTPRTRTRAASPTASDEPDGSISLHARAISVGSKKRADMSRQAADDDNFALSGIGEGVLVPTPYDLVTLNNIIGQSSILPQCIQSVATNVTCYGYRVVPIEEGVKITRDEKKILESYISTPNSDETLAGLQSKKVVDYEKYGYAFIEVIRDASGKPSLLRHCRAFTTRLLTQSGPPVPIVTEVARGGKRSKVTEFRKFRKYAQMTASSSIYYKEFGDPRRMDYTTGTYETEDKPVPEDRAATELLHERQYSEDSYGTPRWVGVMPEILGSREAAEVNMRYFEDNTVPPMILTVAGGRLTRQSYADLTKLLNEQGVGQERQHKILLLEAVAEATGLDDKGTVSLKVDKLTDARQGDGLFSEYDQANMNKIRSTFRLPESAVGQTMASNFACYSEDTETLTDAGWVSMDQWREGMKIAAYNADTQAIQYENAENGLQVYQVENVDMFHILSTQQDILVTPNHRMLYARTKDGSYEIHPIEDMVSSMVNYVRAAATGGYSGGRDSVFFAIPHEEALHTAAKNDHAIRPILVDTLMEWLGYYIADGCAHKESPRISIGAKKQRKVLAFAELHYGLEELGFRVNESTNSAGTYFSVAHKGMVNWIKHNAGTSGVTKRIPGMVWGLKRDMMEILFNALMFCDGTWDKREGRTAGAYSTVSRQLADDVQRLATLLGYKATIKVTGPGQYGVNPVYLVRLSGRSTSQIMTDQHVSRVSYSGRVYCFTVPSGVFVTRRNGKVAFQGNTANISLWAAETQVYAPQRKAHDEFLNRRFVNHPSGLNLKTAKLESCSPSVTIPDQVIRMLTAVNVMGGVTPRSAIEVLNQSMQLTLKQYPEKGQEGWEEWTDVPMPLTLRTAAAPAQQTNQGGSIHTEQGVKTEKIKAIEDTGITGVEAQAVKHGQE